MTLPPFTEEKEMENSSCVGKEATGLDALRDWLAANGFRIGPNPLQDHLNECNWYAYKRSVIPSRECELNDGKPTQIVVTPHAFTTQGHRHESVEVEVCGQYGCWWNLNAYSISPDELPARLPAIEASLVAAWNALATATRSERS